VVSIEMKILNMKRLKMNNDLSKEINNLLKAINEWKKWQHSSDPMQGACLVRRYAEALEDKIQESK